MSVVGKDIGELSPLRLHLIFLPDELTTSQKDSLSFEFSRLFVSAGLQHHRSKMSMLAI